MTDTDGACKQAIPSLVGNVVNDNLNAIRLCLAMLVLFSHSFAVLGLPQPQALGVDLGFHAVHAFFAVSGYLIVGSYMRRPSHRAVRRQPRPDAGLPSTRPETTQDAAPSRPGPPRAVAGKQAGHRTDKVLATVMILPRSLA